MYLTKKRYNRLLSPSPAVSVSIFLLKIAIIAVMLFIIINVDSKIITAFAYIPIIMVMVHLILEIMPNKISNSNIELLLKEGKIVDGIVDSCDYEGFRGITYFVHYHFEDSQGNKHSSQFVLPKKKLKKGGIAEGGKIKISYLEDNPEVHAIIEKNFFDTVLSKRKKG